MSHFGVQSSSHILFLFTTIFPGGQTSKAVNAYDPLFNDPNAQPVRVGSLLQKDEYDFSGALARSTLNRYLWQDNASYFTNNLGGKGAAIGAVAGAGAGTGVAAATGKREAVIPAESVFSFTLTGSK